MSTVSGKYVCSDILHEHDYSQEAVKYQQIFKKNNGMKHVLTYLSIKQMVHQLNSYTRCGINTVRSILSLV